MPGLLETNTEGDETTLLLSSSMEELVLDRLARFLADG